MAQITIEQALGLAGQHHQAGRLAQAEQLYRQILASQPKQVDALHMLGVIALQVGQHDTAVDLIRQAIALKPDLAGAYSNLATALNAKGQLEEAISVCRQAVALKPDDATSHYNLAYTLGNNGQADEAIAAYRQAIALRPNMLAAYNGLGAILGQQGRGDDAVAVFRQAIARPDIDPPGDLAGLHSNLIYAIHHRPDYDAARLLQECQQWAARYEAPLAGEIRRHDNDHNPERRLKIGYVSPDFRLHAAASFLLPLLANHDARNVEIHCYGNVKREDATTEKFKQMDVRWRNCAALPDAQLAETIRRDGIDILVDLALHTANNRLLVFARKPAPVQATWLSYPGTTGMASIDYRLTDRFIDPVGQTDRDYTERSIRLPNCFWCYQPLLENTADVNDLPASTNGHITFGCFNNISKVTPTALRLWARVLSAVANSRLIMHCHPGSHRDGITAFFQGSGIAPARLEFVSRAPLADYFRYFHRVDICFDPVPYAGGTSSFDALWMGVPVVTLSGNTAVSRSGVTILSNAGLPEFIAGSDDEYVSIAARAAEDLERLSELRKSLRGKLQASPLMDGRRFAADIESAYRQMWRTWCAAKGATSY